MNHRKRKREQNLKKERKIIYNPFANDPPDAVCPYCGQKGKICSYTNSLSRAWGRGACAYKYKKENKNEQI